MIKTCHSEHSEESKVLFTGDFSSFQSSKRQTGVTLYIITTIYFVII